MLLCPSLGATVSMDGTAAYLSVAVLYIANLAGVELAFGDQVLLGVTVVALSVGVAALPSASLVMMVVSFKPKSVFQLNTCVNRCRLIGF